MVFGKDIIIIRGLIFKTLMFFKDGNYWDIFFVNKLYIFKLFNLKSMFFKAIFKL